MSVPPPKFLSLKPLRLKCPACNEMFEITDTTRYKGSGHDKAGQMERNYKDHYKHKHIDNSED